MSSNAKVRLEGLDVLRGISAIMIILFHVYYLFGYANKTIFVNFIPRLDIGVQLFFALSAFSLFYGYEKRITQTDGLSKFYINRFFRIAPLFYLCIFIYSLITQKYLNSSINVADLLINFTFTFGLIPGKNESFVWAGWSLGIEWIFYFLFPLFVILCKNLKSTLLFYIISMLVVIRFDYLGIQLQKVSYSAYKLNYLNQLMFFISGIVGYKLYREISFEKWYVRFISLLIMISITYVYFFTNLIGNILGEILISFNIINIILYFANCPPKILVNKFFQMLGASSFGLYLLHPLVIIYFLYSGILYNNHVIPSDDNVGFLTHVVLTLMLTIPIAFLSYKYYESPAMLFAKSKSDILLKEHEANPSRIAALVQNKIKFIITGFIVFSIFVIFINTGWRF
ncbi:acyltransferase family protein [Paenibacillus elgii]|uniref:acyltransferase family protein n=1 Tax=Paenibacillus elgii TaxID=189691 RepID=UPI0013D5B58D|nr:acyltransferase [Paenibacillus elgii]